MGIPGEKTPKGILTRFDGTPVGRLISAFEERPLPEFVSLGMFFLQLSSDAAKHINAGIDRLVLVSAKDGKQHDFSVPNVHEKSGVTVHVSPFPDTEAQKRLSIHCQIRKYDTKSDAWYGLLLAPGSGEIRGAVAIVQKWRPDSTVEKALEAWPKKPMIPLKSISRAPIRHKVGRNELCPCGSGKKFKHCCLNRS